MNTENKIFCFRFRETATNGSRTNNNIKFQFHSKSKLSREIKKSGMEFDEPIFMVKTHDLSDQLNFGTLIAALFDNFFVLLFTSLR